MKKLTELKNYLKGKIFIESIHEYKASSTIPQNYTCILRMGENFKIYGSFVKDEGQKYIRVNRILNFCGDLFRLNPEYLTPEQFHQTEYKLSYQSKLKL